MAAYIYNILPETGRHTDVYSMFFYYLNCVKLPQWDFLDMISTS